MPTYVYKCRVCEKVFEVEQRITEDPLTDCECGETGTVRRVIQRPAIAFSGSGFHINDYATSGNPPSQTSEAPKSSSDSDAS